MDQTRPARAFVAAAVRPRMLGALVLLLLAALVCVRLGAWQLDRARERGELAAERAAAQAAQTAPEALADVLAPQTALTQDGVGRRVAVAGTYLPDSSLVVPGREHEGEPGTVLVAALSVDGAVLPVARGWVPLPAEEALAATGPGGPLALPEGTVRLVGALAGPEAAAPGDAADGVVGSISAAQLVNTWGGPIYDAYLRLQDSDPAQPAAVEPLAATGPQGAGLNLQNVAYAAQWWIFGGFALFVWVRLVRDEAERRAGTGTTADAGA